MTVLGLISVGLSLSCGLFLLYYGLSIQGFPTVVPNSGPTVELLIAFTLTDVGALLTSFSLFAAGTSFSLIKILFMFEFDSGFIIEIPKITAAKIPTLLPDNKVIYAT